METTDVPILLAFFSNSLGQSWRQYGKNWNLGEFWIWAKQTIKRKEDAKALQSSKIHSQLDEKSLIQQMWMAEGRVYGYPKPMPNQGQNKWNLLNFGSQIILPKDSVLLPIHMVKVSSGCRKKRALNSNKSFTVIIFRSCSGCSYLRSRSSWVLRILKDQLN